MSLPLQPSLFGAGDPVPDELFSTLRRCQLDDESWVDLAPAWLPGADALFGELVARRRGSNGNVGCTTIASPSCG